jgi:hypothetical protein
MQKFHWPADEERAFGLCKAVTLRGKPCSRHAFDKRGLCRTHRHAKKEKTS